MKSPVVKPLVLTGIILDDPEDPDDGLEIDIAFVEAIEDVLDRLHLDPQYKFVAFGASDKPYKRLMIRENTPERPLLHCFGNESAHL